MDPSSGHLCVGLVTHQAHYLPLHSYECVLNTLLAKIDSCTFILAK